MHIRPLSPFGAEVIGIDLDDESALDGATCDALRHAWVENGILLFRNALHSEEAHLRLSRVFGDPLIPIRIAFCKGPDGEVIEFFQNEVL